MKSPAPIVTQAHRQRGLAILIFLLSFVVILACGPDFPNMLLTQGDHAILAAPQANFSREIRRLLPAKSLYRYHAPRKDGADSKEAELSDLSEALKARGDTEDQIAQLLDRHAAAR